jgi:hypothetical protein
LLLLFFALTLKFYIELSLNDVVSVVSAVSFVVTVVAAAVAVVKMVPRTRWGGEGM